MTDGATKQAPRRLVIGIGNNDRGDDAIGRIAARALIERVPEDVRVIEHDGEATSLLELLGSVDTVYLIDAAVSGAPPGTVHCFDCARDPLPRGTLQVSTHGIGPSEAIELARALGKLPRRCVVFAIEAGHVGAGGDVSSALVGAVEDVAAQVAAALAAESAPSREEHHA